jgi:hypothetical protein
VNVVYEPPADGLVKAETCRGWRIKNIQWKYMNFVGV